MTTANLDSVKNTTANPIKTIGILGGGQLGMMLAEPAMQLGYRCIFLEDAPNCPASLYGKVYSSQQLEDFVKKADVFTLEFENTPVETVRWLQQLSTDSDTGINTETNTDINTNKNIDNEFSKKQGMYPPPIALEIAQDRLAEKSLFNQLDIATVPFLSVSSEDELNTACDKLGLPLVIKTSRGGYDGKGQFVIRSHEDIAKAWAELGGAVTGQGNLTATPAPLIAEGFIDFSREVSIIAVRGQDAEVRAYDLVENHHHNGILAKTQAPAIGTSHLKQMAQTAISKLMNHLDYVGVLALELFVCKDKHGNDTLLANEIAPRVHNSGHWSIEGAVTSQFENHIRAVVGLPLGDTDIVHPSIMVNVLGEYPKLVDVLAIDGCHYHTYHKEERDNRKIAHITLMPTDTAQLKDSLAELISVLPNKVGL